MEDQAFQLHNQEKLARINNILVVDDDDNWCFLSKRILQRSGYRKEVLTAHNGLEAIRQLQNMAAAGESMPDLIFLDIKMPVMDGFEFLEKITQTTELNLSQTRVFVCSSSLHPRDKEKAGQFPIAGFLNKPLTPEMLHNLL